MKFLIKVIILSNVFMNFFLSNMNAADFSKIDPQLTLLMENPELKSIYQFQYDGLAKASISRYTSVILKTVASNVALESSGVNVQGRIGDVVTATVDINQLQALAELPDITYIQLAKILNTHLDVSVPEMKVPSVYQNYGSAGKNVIIGIIDTGIDWEHRDFRKADGTTRIKYILDFSFPGDTNGDEKLDGKGPYGGTLYIEQDINNALKGLNSILTKNNIKDVVGHGTHVAGCAAGNGLATGNGIPAKRYVGIAPESDLVIVNATREYGSMKFVENDYINALIFIDSIATVLGKPYVANMSLGGNDGPHDGTSLGEQAIDNLVGPGKPGKAVVVSAGNDGDKNIHTSGTFSNSLTSYEIKLQIDDYETNPNTYDDFVLFEMWYSGNTSHSIKLISPGGTEYGPVLKGTELNRNTKDGAIIIQNATGGRSPLNGDHQAIIQIFDFEKTKPPTSGEWKIIITGNTGRFDLWITSKSMAKASFTSNGDQSKLIATPGSAKNAITVGSYVTKNQWQDIDGHNVQLSPLPELYTASVFSSPGPTRDWRTKPDVCAPGEMIASSYSVDAPPASEYSMFDTENDDLPNGFITRDGKHAYAQGTSMSAPQVAGIIALILENFPQYNANQIKDALIKTARFDQNTLSVPNNKWGYGKVDAFQVMKYIDGQNPEKKFSIAIFQNPALIQYIDFYLISKYQLASSPVALMKMNGISSNLITMTAIETQIYKGEYQFASDGTATLSIKAIIQGEPETTLTKFFGVKLLKAIAGGLIEFKDVHLSIPQNSFANDTYFTVIPIENETYNTSWQPISPAYQFGPSDYSFNREVSLAFAYDDRNWDESKISIYKFENEDWKRLESTVDQERNMIIATVDELGTYQLFYDPNLDLSVQLPIKFLLNQNYPNPFNPNTTITYQLPRDTRINIKIFNLKGELVLTLFDGVQSAGSHQIIWNGRDLNNQLLPSGMYIYRLSAGDFSMSRKMLLLK